MMAIMQAAVFGACGKTCVGKYCITTFSLINNAWVGTTWQFDNSIRFDIVDATSYGTSCHGNGPLQQGAQCDGAIDCNFNAGNGTPYYATHACVDPNATTTNFQGCSTCQTGG